jgi:acetyl esterase/lipase
MKHVLLRILIASICILSIVLIAACNGATDAPNSQKGEGGSDAIADNDGKDGSVSDNADKGEAGATTDTTKSADDTIDKEPVDTRSPEQIAADQAVSASIDALADYTFAKADDSSALVQAREGDADMYLVGQVDGQEDTLIYVYQDICYDEDSKYRYIDVYMPNAADKLDPETPVFLYLHGGGWMAGSRKEEWRTLMPYIASTGTVTISMEYGLWFGLNNQKLSPKKKGVYGWNNDIDSVLGAVMQNQYPVSVADMMDDVTCCLTFLRDTYLPSLGLTATNIGIGGYSAGGHLSSLYAYKYAEQSPIPIAYLMDLVGPVELLNEGYLRLLDILTGHYEDETGDAQDLYELIAPLLDQFAAPLAGILGEEEPIYLNTEEGYQHALESIALWQPISFLTEQSVPTIICYARQHDADMKAAEALFVGDFDDFIPISIYTAISAKLDAVGIVHTDILFEELTHTTIGKRTESCKWMAANIAAFASIYCQYQTEANVE